MEELTAWLSQGWVYLVAIIGGITLVWNFINKTLKEMSEAIKKPIKDLDIKLDETVNELKKQINKTQLDNTLIKDALLSLQRRSLYDICEKMLVKGYASINEKMTITEQFKSYEDLGGNSFMHTLVEQVLLLPDEPDV